MKALNDDTFEHLTQAATGATTGDWLVMLCVKINYAYCDRFSYYYYVVL